MRGSSQRILQRKTRNLKVSDRTPTRGFPAIRGRLIFALVGVSFVLGVPFVSLSDQANVDTRTMIIHVSEACESRFVADATIEIFDLATNTRHVLGRTDEHGRATVTFGTEVEALLICKKYFHCVVTFPPIVARSVEIDVALPRWWIR